MSDFGESIPIISTFYDRQNSTDKLSPEVKISGVLPESILVNADIINEGYSEQLEKFEFIIKFTGSLATLSKRYEVEAYDLGFGFAVVNAKKIILEKFEKDENVLYIDKPKRLYIASENGRTVWKKLW